MLQREFSDKFEFSNAGDEDNQQNILKDIIQPICEADVILADLTGLNPNVLYELGVAHTLNKKCITITKDDLNCLPFDLKQYRSKNYDTHFTKFAQSIVYLRKHLEGAIDNSVEFGNPVADFIKDNNDIKIANSQQTQTDEDKGFLDFIADIEEDMSTIIKNLENLASERNIMNNGMADSAKKNKFCNWL